MSAETAKPVVTEIRRTCFAMPSQWEGKFDDGREFYGRYRHGSGYITANLPDGTEFSALNGPILVYYERVGGHGFEGTMSNRQFLAILRTVAHVPDNIVVVPEPDPEDNHEDAPDEPLTITVRPTDD